MPVLGVSASRQTRDCVFEPRHEPGMHLREVMDEFRMHQTKRNTYRLASLVQVFAPFIAVAAYVHVLYLAVRSKD